MVYLFQIHSLGGTTSTCWKKTKLNSEVHYVKSLMSLWLKTLVLKHWLLRLYSQSINNWQRWRLITHTGEWSCEWARTRNLRGFSRQSTNKMTVRNLRLISPNTLHFIVEFGFINLVIWDPVTTRWKNSLRVGSFDGVQEMMQTEPIIFQWVQSASTRNRTVMLRCPICCSADPWKRGRGVTWLVRWWDLFEFIYCASTRFVWPNELIRQFA